MNKLMDLNEAYERIEWQIKHDVDNYDKDPTVAGIIDLERIKVAIDELQAYKDKEDKIIDYIKFNFCNDNDLNDCWHNDFNNILQILNEGDDE